MIDLVNAGLLSQEEYSLFATLGPQNAVTPRPAAQPTGLTPIEYVDTDATAPVFTFFEQLRAQGLPSGYERVGAGASGRQRSG
jgi:hypothetical protein